MRILIISKYASSYENGFESRFFALSRRFVKLNHEVNIISSDSSHFGHYPEYNKIYNFSKIDDINVLRIKTTKYKKSISLLRVLSWIDFEIKLFFAPLKKVQKPDIILVSSLSLITILNGLILRKKFKAKLIFEIRDIWPLTMVVEGGYSKWNPFIILLSIVEKMGYKYADIVIGTMPNLKQHVFNVTNNKKIKCDYVPFGYDQDFFKSNNKSVLELRNKFNIPNDKFIIGYAGSIGLSNGLDAIIECTKLMQGNPKFHFVFLGKGGMVEEYKSKTSEQSNIQFIPSVERSEVSDFLQACDILYFSSLKSEIWEYGWSPNKLIDYMMSGRMVLASYSGYQSMINEAKSGIFIPAEDPFAIQDSLLEIISMSNEERIKMGSSGKKWIQENRNWDDVAKVYLNIMTSL
jgi:glycosyltransferase involved in cell wall biosynthesis